MTDRSTAPASPVAGGPLHADALVLLRGWRAPDAEQEELRRRYVAHLERAPDGLDRSCYPDHLTASTLVLSADRSRVLLTRHAKAKAWFQLGGHCEPTDTSLAGAALREAVEESGITRLRMDPQPVQLSPHLVPFCDPRGGVHHLDVRFVAVAPDDAVHAVSAESDDVAWWPAGVLPNQDPDLLALVDLARQRAL